MPGDFGAYMSMQAEQRGQRIQELVAERDRLREALTFINAIAGTAEEGEVKALNDICRASHAALNPS